MTSRPELGSVLVGSTDPDRLRDWYRKAFGAEVAPNGVVSFGSTDVLFESRDDVAAANAEPGRFILNFHVASAEEACAHLDSLDVEWLVLPEQREHGIFATLTDPDGNYIQIIELADSGNGSLAPAVDGGIPYSGFSVDNLGAAREFYESTLGMSVTDDGAGFWLHISDEAAPILVYETPAHIPGSFTILNLPVNDIDTVVDRLTANAQQFLRYPEIEQDRRGIHRGIEGGTGPDIAWFADPAGNIISVLSEPTE